MKPGKDTTQNTPTAQVPAPVSSKIENAIYGLRALNYCFGHHADYEALQRVLAVLMDAAARVRIMEQVLYLPEDGHASL